MQVIEVKTADLADKAAPYNPRKISAHDLEALRRSLKFFGTVEPIVVNTRSGHIVGGHQRVKAAEAEGIETLPVVHVDLDEPSEKQLNLALNRISGEFDLNKLANIWGTPFDDSRGRRNAQHKPKQFSAGRETKHSWQTN